MSFVEIFEMCHRIQLRNQLRLEELTLTFSDLLLTKLLLVQAAELASTLDIAPKTIGFRTRARIGERVRYELPDEV